VSIVIYGERSTYFSLWRRRSQEMMRGITPADIAVLTVYLK
jgi:hypothetical protein